MPKATSASESLMAGHTSGLRKRGNHPQRGMPSHLSQNQRDLPSVGSAGISNGDATEDDVENPVPLSDSDSSQEYDFDHHETVDTSFGEYEDESLSSKTPAPLERDGNGATVTPDEVGVGETINDLFGLTNKAAKRNAEGPTDRPKDPSPLAPGASKAWYEFDLAVIIALASPIGNWLTGGDHVKKLVLITLVVYYLHQIIESELHRSYTDPRLMFGKYLGTCIIRHARGDADSLLRLTLKAPGSSTLPKENSASSKSFSSFYR